MRVRRAAAVLCAVPIVFGLAYAPATQAATGTDPATATRGRVPGAEANRDLGADQIAAIAAANGMSPARLRELLATDATLWVSKSGTLIYEDRPIPKDAQAELAKRPAPTGVFPNSQTFLLHSRPGSNRVLYLDFDGYHLPAGTIWHRGTTYDALAYSVDGDQRFNQTELDNIQAIWQQVAEDYAPFDVDVTTQDPGAAAIKRSTASDLKYGGRVVMSSSPMLDICSSPCGGVSAVGNVDSIGAAHDENQPSWGFTEGAGTSPHGMNYAASHEFGHAIGLSHDGRTKPVEEYYSGHGMWAPIMGGTYTQPVSQWSKGEYKKPSNTEDDFVVAANNNVTLIADDNLNGGTAPDRNVVLGAPQLVGATPAGDADSWRFDAPCTGSYVFTADSAPNSPNLSLELQLYAFGGSFLQSDLAQPIRVDDDVASGMGGQISANLTAGNAYTFAVLPLANGTAATGWTNYANVGRYTISASSSCANNDSFIFPTTLHGPDEKLTGSNVGYTSEAGEPIPPCTSDFGTTTAWWAWTAPATGKVTFDTIGSDFDTVLAVYSGSALNALTSVACDDDITPAVAQSKATFTATAGTTYRIQVDGFGGGAGTIKLQTSGCLGKGNDPFKCAKTLTKPTTGENNGFTVQAGEPSASQPCVDNSGDQSTNTAWWNWTAPATGAFKIDTIGSDFDTVLAVYSGKKLNALNQIACDDDAGGAGTSLLTFNASAGTTYRIQVDGFDGATGGIKLRALAP